MDAKKIGSCVADIIDDVRNSGDKAVFEYLKKFDGVDLSKRGYKISQKTMDDAVKHVPVSLKKTIKASYSNILAYHRYECSQIKKKWYYVGNEGLIIGQFCTSVDSVGIYVPGGRFPYLSTVIMAAVPAVVAGVKRIVMVTPPKNISDAVLFAAKLCSIKEIYCVGGAVAVAALAYGTKTVEKVDMIVGPGNTYVNEAKRQVFGDVGVDSLAGPSEVAVIADKDVPVEYVVADIMAQVEHDPMAKAYLLCESASKVSEIKKLIPKQAMKQLKIEVCSIAKAIRMVNAIAPEHLELLVKNHKNLMKDIKNVGAVFAGYQTPTASGDYLAGPSHVLPTNGSAKFSSGLSVMTFLKRSAYIEIDKNNKKAYETIADFAQFENMYYHKKSADVRVSSLCSSNLRNNQK
ncbi:MAG: histidinol dehydrogenase [Endomicrobium sp.]|jgi:histidinol dehydrogenase|nr:histidinol dehydrogenase [Endomicrobium sp.]